MDCKRCRKSASLREEWGCERDTPVPTFEIPCSLCEGAGDETCPTCKGRGVEGITRCPNVTLPSVYRQTISAVSMAKQGLGLPFNGGTFDQSEWFLRALAFVSGIVDEEKGAESR